MSAEHLKRTVANTIAGVSLHWNGYNKQPSDLYAAMAERLVDAQLVQSPETAEELEHLRKDRDRFRDQRNGVFQTNRKLLAELEQEQVARLRAENETRTLTRELEQLRARVAELEALTPAEIQTCRVCGAGYTYGKRCTTCEFRARMAAEVSADNVSPQVEELRALLAGQRAEVEDPHDSPLHHEYRIPHDLPETGGEGRG